MPKRNAVMPITNGNGASAFYWACNPEVLRLDSNKNTCAGDLSCQDITLGNGATIVNTSADY